MVVNTFPALRKRFLWWLSTAEEELLKDCIVDQNRYSIIGMLVMGTWAFATLAWSYFFSTVVSQWWVAVLLGIFMGWLILQIDRALIKGMKRNSKQTFLPILFRGLLATSIGLFMAQPALLFLFDKEVKVQASLDNEVRKKEKRKVQEDVYYRERTALLLKKKIAATTLNQQYVEVNKAREAFIQETDGTGGSKKIGLKDIAMAKQSAYLKLDADYKQSLKVLTPEISYADSVLKTIDSQIQLEQQSFQTLLNTGFITRIEALNHLVQNNTAVAFRYYLLVSILLLIELMPLLAKLLLPAGTYELKAQLQEELETKIAKANQAQITNFFESTTYARTEKSNEKIRSWQIDSTKTYESLWREFKQDLLTNQP